MRIFLLAVFLVLNSSPYAQYLCGTVATAERSRWVENVLKRSSSRDYDGQTPTIRLALHRITRDDGTGGNSWLDIRNEIERLPEFFNPHNICFTIVEEGEIQSDVYFSIGTGLFSSIVLDPEYPNLINENRIVSAINIYFLPQANGGVATGFLFPNGPTIFPTVVLGTSTTGTLNTFNAEVLSHELGHCLGLYHTHEASATCEEAGDNSECSECGDLVCDTPPDRGLRVSSDSVSDDECNYIGSIDLLDGAPYEPDTRNVMSYTLPDCMLRFSDGQGDRMRDFIYNATDMDNFIIPANIILSGNLDGFYGAELTVTSTATHNNGNTSYAAANQISLRPGFSAVSSTANSSFQAHIEAIDCEAPLVRNSGRLGTPIPSTHLLDEYWSLRLIPNPAHDAVTLIPSRRISAACRLKLIDGAGKVVLQKKVQNSSRTGIRLDVSSLPAGFYSLALISGERFMVRRLVIR